MIGSIQAEQGQNLFDFFCSKKKLVVTVHRTENYSTKPEKWSMRNKIVLAIAQLWAIKTVECMVRICDLNLQLGRKSFRNIISWQSLIPFSAHRRWLVINFEQKLQQYLFKSYVPKYFQKILFTEFENHIQYNENSV